MVRKMLAPKASRACQVAVIAAALLAAALIGSTVAYYSYVKTTRYATLTGEHIVITGEARVESTLMVFLDGSWHYLVTVRSNLDHTANFTVQVYFNDVDLGTQTAEIPANGVHVFYFNTQLQQLPDSFSTTVYVSVAED